MRTLSQVVDQLSQRQPDDRGTRAAASGDGEPAATETRKRARAEGEEGNREDSGEGSGVRLPDATRKGPVDGSAESQGSDAMDETDTAGLEASHDPSPPSPGRPGDAEGGAGGRGDTAATEKTQAAADPGEDMDAELPPAAAAAAAAAAEETNGQAEGQMLQIRELEGRISYSLHTFDEAPFTIQRIAELLAWPDRHYRSVLKFLRAIERVVYVTSTVEEFPTAIQGRTSDDTGDDEYPIAADAIEQEEGAPSATPPLSSFLAPTGSTTATVTGAGDSATVRPTVSAVGQPASATGRKGWALGASAPVPVSSMVPAMDIPPLDASDTGILHIRRSLADDRDALRTKIQSSVDVAVPVCIDEPDGTNGKIAVVPVHPNGAGSPDASADPSS
ncbi:hypothetical protein LPJ61_004050 [Coemansia biformis]|uniref:PPP4R2-domain-containing protein n=1 Tax=Coemansia biformis TaxID=1286918 RepID=A0A9W7YBM6_9FUNG|nr:hypothetical protein LPJ61_004050 [Coemansia biformis]